MVAYFLSRLTLLIGNEEMGATLLLRGQHPKFYKLVTTSPLYNKMPEGTPLGMISAKG